MKLTSWPSFMMAPFMLPSAAATSSADRMAKRCSSSALRASSAPTPRTLTVAQCAPRRVVSHHTRAERSTRLRRCGSRSAAPAADAAPTITAAVPTATTARVFVTRRGACRSGGPPDRQRALRQPASPSTPRRWRRCPRRAGPAPARRRRGRRRWRRGGRCDRRRRARHERTDPDRRALAFPQDSVGDAGARPGRRAPREVPRRDGRHRVAGCPIPSPPPTGRRPSPSSSRTCPRWASIPPSATPPRWRPAWANWSSPSTRSVRRRP